MMRNTTPIMKSLLSRSGVLSVYHKSIAEAAAVAGCDLGAEKGLAPTMTSQRLNLVVQVTMFLQLVFQRNANEMGKLA